MSNKNTITVTGNLTSDPQLSYLTSGKAAARFRIASTARYRDSEGQWHDRETIFLSVDVFGTLAENVAASLAKGLEVHVTGELRLNKWTDKATGEAREGFSVVAERVSPSLDHATAEVARVQRNRPAAAPAAAPAPAAQAAPAPAAAAPAPAAAPAAPVPAGVATAPAPF